MKLHKAILMALALLTPSASFADSGTEVWNSVKDWSIYCPHEEMGTITAYCIIDVDNDGISDCFVSGDYDSYGFLTCGDGNGGASADNIELVINSINTSSLSVAVSRGKGWVVHSGGCGTSCYIMEFYKIDNSKWTICYQDVDTVRYIEGEDEDIEVESEYSFYKPAVPPRRISEEYYYRKTPFHASFIDTVEFEWTQIR